MEDSEETSQSLQIDLGPLQSDQQTASSQDGQGKGDDVIVIDSDDEEEEEDENDGNMRIMKKMKTMMMMMKMTQGWETRVKIVTKVPAVRTAMTDMRLMMLRVVMGLIQVQKQKKVWVEVKVIREQLILKTVAKEILVLQSPLFPRRYLENSSHHRHLKDRPPSTSVTKTPTTPTSPKTDHSCSTSGAGTASSENSDDPKAVCRTWASVDSRNRWHAAAFLMMKIEQFQVPQLLWCHIVLMDLLKQFILHR